MKRRFKSKSRVSSRTSRAYEQTVKGKKSKVYFELDEQCMSKQSRNKRLRFKSKSRVSSRTSRAYEQTVKKSKVYFELDEQCMSKQSRNKRLTRPGIEPGSVPWQGTILPLDHRVF